MCDIADLITKVKFYENILRGFGDLTCGFLSISVGLADCSYNSVSIAVLHNDVHTHNLHAI